MDALNLLISDHNRVRGLFARFAKAKEADDAATMGSLAMEIVAELEVHTAIEEEIFYPWAHDLSDEIGASIDEGLQEHHVVKILIEEIGSLSAGAPEWVAKMQVLIENVEHHAEEEESELFPPVRSHTSADDRKSLGEKMDARKGALGAPVLADKADLTDARLHELATEQEIPGRSKMDRDELAATVSPG
ncbi:MAG: hemerythrin domain-containing protein [Acidimicrobiales bacterium]